MPSPRLPAFALFAALALAGCVEDAVDPAELRGDPAPSPVETLDAVAEVLVADHSVGDRRFRVHAHAEDGEVCVTVTADEGSTTDCGRVRGPLEVRVVASGDLEVLIGLVEDPAIRDLRLIANDGSSIPDEVEDAVVTEVPGSGGIRVLAPSFAPVLVPRIEGLDADGDVIAEASIDDLDD